MPSGHDNAGAAGGREVLGHVVHEQHFAALGLHREAVVWLDAAFRRHEGRVREDNVGVFVPLVLRSQRVVLGDMRVGESMQVQVHQRQAHHVGRDVVTLEVGGEAAFFVGSKQIADRLHCPLTPALSRKRARGGVLFEDMLPG